MTTDLSKYDASQLPSADVLGRQRYAIVVADWNSEITYAMAQGAIDTFIKHGVEEDNIDVIHVPGAVELTFGAARIMKEERVNAVIVIGCVIRLCVPIRDARRSDAERARQSAGDFLGSDNPEQTTGAGPLRRQTREQRYRRRLYRH